MEVETLSTPFHVGDRVRCTDKVGNRLEGKEGIIIYVGHPGTEKLHILVEFDERFPGGHHGDRTYAIGKEGHCYWINADNGEAELTEKRVTVDENSWFDVKLIKNAPSHLKAILQRIETPWKEAIKQEQAKRRKIPFEGIEYECILGTNGTLVKCLEDKLVIKKVLYNRQTFILTKPIQKEGYRMWAAFDKNAQLAHLCSDTPFGAHYTGRSPYITTIHFQTICTGDVRLEHATTLTALKEKAKEVFKALHIINRDSLGELHLPDEYDLLRNILMGNEGSIPEAFKKHKVAKLLL